MLKSLVVWLTYRCNFNCLYCREWRRKADVETDSEKWIEAFNTLPPATIDFTGGEPFLHPGIYDILNGIAEKHFVAVTTNLSVVDVSRLPKDIDSFTISFHPSQFDKFSLKEFIKKAQFLKEKCKVVSINYVAHASQIKNIPYYYKYFTSLGFRFHVDPDMYHVYPREEMEAILPYLSDDRIIGKTDFLSGPKLCNAGMQHIHVAPDGTVFRCYFNRVTLGNFFKGYQLYPNLKLCNTRCGSGCDLDKVKIILLKEEEQRGEKNRENED